MKIQFKPFALNKEEHPEELLISELTNGFDLSLEPQAFGLAIKSYYSEPVSFGTYALHLSFYAVEDIDCLYIFTGRKQLRDIISLKKGDRYEKTFYQSVAEIIPRYHNTSYPVSHLFFSFAGDSLQNIKLENCYASKDNTITRIFLCGDSTVTDQSCEIPYYPGACYSSWGQNLPAFLTSKVAVENQAHSGLTTESFRKEGHFDLVKKHIQTGDYCLFQFGHNDQKLSHLLANREYPSNLRRFIKEVRELNGIPVLVSPLTRNIWDKDHKYLDLLKEHAQAVDKVAKEENVPLIDLYNFSKDFILRNGKEKSTGYFHLEDYTHTNEYGSYLFASFISQRLSSLFPQVIVSRLPSCDFKPPANLWDKLNKKNKKQVTNEEKEIFDQAEKSVDNLLQMIKQN